MDPSASIQTTAASANKQQRNKFSDRQYFSRSTLLFGILALIISAILSGLANSLNPNSILIWLHLILLVFGFKILVLTPRRQMYEIYDDDDDDGAKGDHLVKGVSVDIEGDRTNMLLLVGGEEDNSANNGSKQDSIVNQNDVSFLDVEVVFVPSFSFKFCILASVFVIITHGLGMCLGFSTLFGYPKNTPESTLLSWGAGIGIWILIVILSLWPAYLFTKKFKEFQKLRYFTFFIFPICFTATTHCIIGSVFSSFTCISNAVLDYELLRQLSAIIGNTGITFTVTLISSLIADYYVLWFLDRSTYFGVGDKTKNKLRQTLSIEKEQLCNVFAIVFGLFIFFMTITGFMVQSDAFYQKPVSNQIVPTWQVSCIFAQVAESGSSLREAVWNRTKARASSGDKIILWSEEAFSIESNDDENQVIDDAKQIAKSSGSYIGITYLKQLPDADLATNQFALITPDGNVAWNYHKAYPVPFIEDDVKAGPPVLPTYYDSEYDLTFGGGICFDLDFSQYIRQAGVKKVNIMLQPSWTWNAISSRHFNGDAVRAIENGFNLLRCSSEGESGTIGTAGRVNTRQFTGSGTKNADSTTNDVPISIFFLPLAARVDTMFTAVGFIFEYLLMIAAIVIYISIIIPLKYISVLVNISEMSKSV